MPAWDNVQLQGPPQAPSYAAPNIGIQLGALLGNLPQDYLGGVEAQQKIRQLGLINQILGQQTGGGNAGTAGTGSTAMPGGDIYGAVLGQESGNNDKVADSSAGAIGPGQILPSTFNQYAKAGEDIRDPATNRAVSKRILDDYLQRYNGDVPRALTAYYSGPGNVAPAGSQAPWLADKQPKGGPSVSQYVRQTMGRMDPQARAGGGQVASADPNFVPQQGGPGLNPANRAAVDAMYPPAGGQPASAESAQQPGAPTTQVAQAGPQGAPQGGSAASALVPQQWRTDPRGYADALGNRANQLRKEADRIESGAKIQAGPIKIEPKAEGLRKAADDADATRSRVLDAIKQQAEPTTGQKEASDPAILRSKGQEEVQTGDIKRGQATFNGITAAARQYETDLKPYLDLTRSIVNDPRAYTGIGAERRLDWNRVTAQWGNGNAAMLKEMLNKVRAQTVLNTINTQKDEMSEASGGPGSSSSRLFSQQVQQIEKAVPGLETTLGGNRALVEIATRVGEHQSQMAQMARDYIADQKHRGGPGYLDPGFDQKISERMKARPLFTDQERAHPELLGAPTMPPTVKSAQDLSNWGKSLGLSSGDAFRTASGQIRALP